MLSFILLSVRSEKLDYRRIKLTRLFQIRHVSTLIEHNQLRAGDIFLKTLALGQRHQAVFTSPNDQRGSFDRLYSVVEKVFATDDRLGDAFDREAVAGGEARSNRHIDRRARLKCLVVETFG